MKARVKVLLLLTLSEWGGAQHIVYLLAKHLSDEYDITVACAPGGALIEKLRNESVCVVEIPQLTRLPSPWCDLRALFRLYLWMRRERFDLVHTHSTKAGLLGRLAAKLAGVPAVLFTAHGWAFTEGRTWWKRWLLAQVERMTTRLTTKIICVSEHDRELALQFTVAAPQNLVVIHNGIDPVPFLQASGARVQQELKLKGGPVLTFVGRLAPPKDLLTLLKAFERIRGGSLILVGDGPLRLQVEQFVRRRSLNDRVALLGARTDIPEILAASDVFVLPSRWEGLPLTIIEAMMAGLPVIATRVGGVSELVEDGVTGFLVPPRDPVALAKAIQKLFDDEELRLKMSQAGRKKALREFTLDRMLAETQRVYEEVLAAKPSSYSRCQGQIPGA